MSAKKPFLIIIPFALAALLGAAYFASQSQSQITTYENRTPPRSEPIAPPRPEPRIQKPETEPKEVSLFAVGDIMLSRTVAKKMKLKNDFNYPFLKTKDFLKTGDLVFGNLETSITPGREIQTEEFTFRADPGVEKSLALAGFSILSLANNHTPNFGAKGLKDTFKYLDQAGIKYVGAGENEEKTNEIVYLESKGFKFAFLAYSSPVFAPASYFAKGGAPGIAMMDIEKMAEAVAKAKEKADFVIVSMHAGEEYVQKPNQFQIKFARAAIEAGAELVIGHHPHVLQTVEKYKGKYIFYSLGNFVFDQMWSQQTREGVIAKAIFNKNGVIKVEFTPVLIADYCQPSILEGKEAETILKRLF